jgi:hypothetical protein
MPPESPQPGFGHSSAHPDCCAHAAAETETPLGNPAGAVAPEPELREGGRWTALKRHALWFLTFFGIYASSSVCPCCGTPGCPVGIGGAAVVGGVFACLWQYGKSAWEKLRGFVDKLPWLVWGHPRK